jgi:hypothetical protein
VAACIAEVFHAVRPSTWVGRGAELAIFDSAVDLLADGRGSVVWVEGEPGIGKSSLVAKGIAAAAPDVAAELLQREADHARVDDGNRHSLAIALARVLGCPPHRSLVRPVASDPHRHLIRARHPVGRALHIHLAEHGGQRAGVAGLHPGTGRFLDAGDVIAAFLPPRAQLQMILQQDTEQLSGHHRQPFLKVGVDLAVGLRIVQDGHQRIEALT